MNINVTPPVAAIKPVEIAIHGDRIIDPYAWLENRDDPAVIAHLEAENAYTAATLAPVQDLAQQIYREMRGRIKEDDATVPERIGAYEYYFRSETGEQYPRYCRRHSPDGDEELLLNGNLLAAGLNFFRFGEVHPSPDQRKLLYTVDSTGAWVFTLYVLDLDSGELLGAPVPNVAYDSAWLNDSRTLLYTVFDQTHRSYRLYRRPIAADPAAAELIYEEGDDRFALSLAKTRSQAYLTLTSFSYSATEVRYAPADDPAAPFTVFAPRRAPIEYFLDHQGDHFLIRTNEHAENFKLLLAPVSDPSRQRELIPHRPDTLLTDVDPFATKLVLHERRNGLRQLRISDPDGNNEHYVEFPEVAYTLSAWNNPEYASTILRLNYASMITPPQVVDYDMQSRTWLVRKQEEIPSGYNQADYVTERLEALAADGARVPISIVYRRDRPQNGGPALLTGYGAYGSTVEPGFDSKRLSLLDRGFAVAIAHIRGGNDLGRRWYEEGRLMHKKNTFSDFIACAEQLFARGYTSPEQLAISGTSAGGLLVSAVITLRPDICRAVLARVPWTNVIAALVKPELPLTVIEWLQWGDPAIEEQYRYMRSYDPYDNVAPGPYPHIMATAGLTDLQVPYWDPAKWVARLRTAKTDDTMLVLRTNMAAGHGGASGRFSYLEEIAQEYAFMLMALGRNTEF
ncbi:MAG: S9 family peptidase [Oscillochloris sp.]|nr:S9 family peptidase [Oscillochloris sp.]